MLEETIRNISLKVPIKEEQGDYYINDILYCNKCKTPKQCKISLFDVEQIVPCLCKCSAEKAEQEKIEFENQQFLDRVKENTKTAFEEVKMRSCKFSKDTLSESNISVAMKKYVENFSELSKEGKGLLLYGSVGTGKTFYAACICNELLNQGKKVLFTSITKVINTMQGLYEDKQEYINNLNSFKLIVFDDLGVERSTEYMQEQAYNIIDSRVKAGLSTIFTTNLTIEQMKNPETITSQRIYSRILENCMPIEFKGKDIRRKKSSDNFFEMKELLGL